MKLTIRLMARQSNIWYDTHVHYKHTNEIKTNEKRKNNQRNILDKKSRTNNENQLTCCNLLAIKVYFTHWQKHILTDLIFVRVFCGYWSLCLVFSKIEQTFLLVLEVAHSLLVFFPTSIIVFMLSIWKIIDW